MSKEIHLFADSLTALMVISFVLLEFISQRRAVKSSEGNVLQTYLFQTAGYCVSYIPCSWNDGGFPDGQFLMTSVPRFICSESSNHQVKLEGAINIMHCSYGSIAICIVGPVKVSLYSLIDLCNLFPLFNQVVSYRKYVLVAASPYQFVQNFIFHSSFIYSIAVVLLLYVEFKLLLLDYDIYLSISICKWQYMV